MINRTSGVLKLVRTICVIALGYFASLSAANADTIRIGLQNLPTSLGTPFGSFNIPTGIPLTTVFDALTWIDENGDTKPALAERWEQESPTTWLFYLRKGVAFSNGEVFDADAVVAVIETLMSGPAASTSLGTTLRRLTVTGATARSSHVVAISTQKPDVLFAQYMRALRIPAPKALAELGLDEFALAPVGTGPFAATEWGESKISFTAYSDSWRAPKESALEIIQLSDGASRRQGVISGSIDVAFGLAPDDAGPVEAAGGRIWVRNEPGVHFLAFVTVKESPLQDARVRRALNHAVNKQRMIDVFMDGAVKPASQIAHTMSYGYNDDLEPYAYDVERARQLITEAGYPDGFDLPILLVPGGAANSQDWYQQIASDLSQVGVRMEIRATRLPNYFDYMYNGGWPSLGFAMVTYTFDPLAAYRTRSCSWTHPYHCDPTIMPLIDKAIAASTPGNRKRLTRDVLRHEYEQPPGIFLWQSVSFEGLGPRVKTYWSGADTVRVEDIVLSD
ncbi:MAG: ABC transporter substrate-binding protein [Rhodospirillaceae bacterium]|jgi:peptide/nickel transport system substrate-binding protein|nr:ABC transporter substrate-binding protein [Rhodospirillaceae bacterium]MBT5239998.1 ABC transporter substrate-binding protein [Rhodospirillaceae bacterium]MBT5564340.1 ABC transporter substrate-binding protein [Rhodospirillaceae bacterium]MBT6090097.1 ABC transporter substrate-binding protein [Rhodospirillaceae bacterium]MBT6959861.1 ABC transporter substrate-binding protein [Rhodospirillaceae bacterium]